MNLRRALQSLLEVPSITQDEIRLKVRQSILEELRLNLDLAIMATPTGPLRDDLTTMNIALSYHEMGDRVDPLLDVKDYRVPERLGGP